jgi:hypothetical protein
MTADDRLASAVGFDVTDYELRWPRELFTRELAVLRRGPGAMVSGAGQRDRISFLLTEAFVGEAPQNDFLAATSQPGSDPWDDPFGRPAGHRHLEQLVEQLPRVREHREPRPYWPTRQGPDPTAGSRVSARHRFAALIAELHARGYFGRDLPPPCVDDYEGIDEAAVLAGRLGVPDLWPLRPDSWDQGTFLGLVEVFHDLAVRPREREWHSHNGCGWHYSAFSADTGRALYRWRINGLLASAGVALELAADGEDAGRLVHLVDPGRAELIERALATTDADARGRVEHAIALFRGRAATEHDKRSAIVALANVLEDRRRQLKTSLFSDDEGALFQIANRFDLRHRNDKQHTDYDPAFRDWVFWWYLATIELTDRLLARQADGEATA